MARGKGQAAKPAPMAAKAPIPKVPPPLRGLVNESNTCWLNSLIQGWLSIPRVISLLEKGDVQLDGGAPSELIAICFELQDLCRARHRSSPQDKGDVRPLQAALQAARHHLGHLQEKDAFVPGEFYSPMEALALMHKALAAGYGTNKTADLFCVQGAGLMRCDVGPCNVRRQETCFAGSVPYGCSICGNGSLAAAMAERGLGAVGHPHDCSCGPTSALLEQSRLTGQLSIVRLPLVLAVASEIDAGHRNLWSIQRLPAVEDLAPVLQGGASANEARANYRLLSLVVEATGGGHYVAYGAASVSADTDDAPPSEYYLYNDDRPPYFIGTHVDLMRHLQQHKENPVIAFYEAAPGVSTEARTSPFYGVNAQEEALVESAPMTQQQGAGLASDSVMEGLLADLMEHQTQLYSNLAVQTAETKAARAAETAAKEETAAAKAQAAAANALADEQLKAAQAASKETVAAKKAASAAREQLIRMQRERDAARTAEATARQAESDALAAKADALHARGAAVAAEAKARAIATEAMRRAQRMETETAAALEQRDRAAAQAEAQQAAAQQAKAEVQEVSAAREAADRAHVSAESDAAAARALRNEAEAKAREAAAETAAVRTQLAAALSELQAAIKNAKMHEERAAAAEMAAANAKSEAAAANEAAELYKAAAEEPEAARAQARDDCAAALAAKVKAEMAATLAQEEASCAKELQAQAQSAADNATAEAAASAAAQQAASEEAAGKLQKAEEEAQRLRAELAAALEANASLKAAVQAAQQQQTASAGADSSAHRRSGSSGGLRGWLSQRFSRNSSGSSRGPPAPETPGAAETPVRGSGSDGSGRTSRSQEEGNGEVVTVEVVVAVPGSSDGNTTAAKIKRRWLQARAEGRGVFRNGGAAVVVGADASIKGRGKEAKQQSAGPRLTAGARLRCALWGCGLKL